MMRKVNRTASITIVLGSNLRLLSSSMTTVIIFISINLRSINLSALQSESG
jgi:hypothetical protein